ncbi:hypothetical protein [Acidovorax delafieldii]|uniref:hypothetical protein n=1 Tax=Acidovorax delafieldii TaxID=47920 RepID=UPI00058FC90F|nr:hypothetical protein [Acidovorax delafieldii]
MAAGDVASPARLVRPVPLPVAVALAPLVFASLAFCLVAAGLVPGLLFAIPAGILLAARILGLACLAFAAASRSRWARSWSRHCSRSRQSLRSS